MSVVSWAGLKVVGCGSSENCSFPEGLAEGVFQVIRSTQSSMASRKIYYFDMLVVCCRPQLDKIFPDFFDHYGRGEDFILSPSIIILCADTRKSGKKGKGYSTGHAKTARECLTRSAQQIGLQADWTTLFDEEKIRNIFVIPPWNRVVKILSLSYPHEKPTGCPQCHHVDYSCVNRSEKILDN